MGESENVAPATVIERTVTAVVPLDTSVMVLDPWEPTVILPNSTLVGAESEASGAAAAPVPARLMVLGLPAALSVSVIWPCWAPALDGAKLSGSATCCRGCLADNRSSTGNTSVHQPASA